MKLNKKFLDALAPRRDCSRGRCATHKKLSQHALVYHVLPQGKQTIIVRVVKPNIFVFPQDFLLDALNVVIVNIYHSLRIKVSERKENKDLCRLGAEV